MSFNPNIPNVNDAMPQSQGQIKSNFRAIYNVFARNHVPLTNETSPTQGMHNLLQFREQSGNPVTNSSQVAIYTKNVGGAPAIFYAPSSAQTPIQLTYRSIKADSSNTQYTFMAGPFIVYGGFLPGCVQNQAVNLTPASTLIYVGFGAIHNKDNSILIFENACATNISGSSFNVQFSNSSVPLDLYYLAIGM